MLTATLVTAAFLPVYLWLRHPFRRLPLHIDTGFYVSNHTIATGEFRFSKGWNARFAGCSKVLPELFYSLVYLVTARPREGMVRRDDAYKTYSRLFAALYNFVTAVAVGLLACRLSGGELVYYYAGLVLFALVSSEAQYGVYFENGELFGILWNVIAIGLLAAGMSAGSAALVALGVFVWACEAFFIKLSSAIALGVVIAGTALIAPYHALPMLIGGASALALYVLWIVRNGRSPAALLRPLFGHETAVGQRRDWSTVTLRLVEKLRCLTRTLRRQPLIPTLAIVGLILQPTGHTMIWFWLAGVTVAYLIQAADCWYYQIPLLPLMALFAVPAVTTLVATGPVGIAVLTGIGLLWLWLNTLRAHRMNSAVLNEWCWRGYRPVGETAANGQLEAFVRQIKPIVRNRSVLVYGPFNQAYVLLDASYDTPIVAPEYYMDAMCHGWQAGLNRQLVASPPDFVLDTSDCFAPATARKHLGLDYRLSGTGAGRFRLYALERVTPPRDDFALARTFEPQSSAALAEEMPEATLATAPSDEAAALERLLDALSARGHQRVAVYGAGRFTVRNRHVYERSKTAIVAFLDDNPQRLGPTFLESPLCRPEEAERFNIDAVVISTDRFVKSMAARARRLWGDRIAVVAITDDE